MKIYSTPSTTVMNAEVENAILVGSIPGNITGGTNLPTTGVWNPAANNGEGAYVWFVQFGNMWYPCDNSNGDNPVTGQGTPELPTF